MGFSVISPELRFRVLDALQTLDFEGARLINLGPHAVIHFGNGVPKVFLCAWLDLLPKVVNEAVKWAERMGYVTVRLGDLFRTMLPWVYPERYRTKAKLIFARPDGKCALIQWEPAPHRGFVVVAVGGVPESENVFRVNEFLPWVKSSPREQLIRITGDGLRWLDANADRWSPRLDDLVTLSQVAPLTGYCKETLGRSVRTGKLPKPDIHGGNGKANKWYWSKIRPALERIAKRQLPRRFPSSQII